MMHPLFSIRNPRYVTEKVYILLEKEKGGTAEKQSRLVRISVFSLRRFLS